MKLTSKARRVIAAMRAGNDTKAKRAKRGLSRRTRTAVENAQDQSFISNIVNQTTTALAEGKNETDKLRGH